METDDLTRDDVLGRLISKTSLESPSGAFTEKVMEGIMPEAVLVRARKPFFYYVKSSWPWVVLGIFVVAVLYMTGIPYKDFLPEKNMFGSTLVPYYESLFKGLKNMFTGNKAISFTLMLVFAGGILYGFDLLLNRKLSARHHTA